MIEELRERSRERAAEVAERLNAVTTNAGQVRVEWRARARACVCVSVCVCVCQCVCVTSHGEWGGGTDVYVCVCAVARQGFARDRETIEQQLRLDKSAIEVRFKTREDAVMQRMSSAVDRCEMATSAAGPSGQHV